RTPLTFAGIGEKSYNGSDLVVSCNSIGSCFSSPPARSISSSWTGMWSTSRRSASSALTRCARPWAVVGPREADRSSCSPRRFETRLVPFADRPRSLGGGRDRGEVPPAVWPLRLVLAQRRAGESHGRGAAHRDVRGDPHARDHREGDRGFRVRDSSVLCPAGPHGVPDLRAQRPRDVLTVEARREYGEPLIPPSLLRTESAGQLGGPAA